MQLVAFRAIHFGGLSLGWKSTNWRFYIMVQMFCSSGRRWKLGIPFLLYVSVLGWGLRWEYLSLSYHFNVWMFLFVPRVVGGHLVSVFPWGNCSKCSCTFQVHSWEFIKVLESPMLPFWLTLPSLLIHSFIYFGGARPWLWHTRSSFLTKDWIWAPCIGSVEL